MGIIGCGHIGTLILKNISSYDANIFVSTNKHERLINYQSKFKLSRYLNMWKQLRSS